jgi:glucose-6-phosphate 1-dehydrogenase
MVMTPAKLNFDYADKFGPNTAPAYERLLQDALLGDASLFIHSEEIEASWRFADAIRLGWSERRVPIREYAAGSWGPTEAEELFHGCEGGWSRG